MSQRRVFLEGPVGPAGPVLAPGEDHHARNVLRLRQGAEVLGLDGVGGVWPLMVLAVERRGLVLESTGPAQHQAPPKPDIEMWVSLPRGGRAEDMLDRLTQLGMGRLQPTWFERTQAGDRELPGRRLDRLMRAAREACKQCGRAWLPAVSTPAPPTGWEAPALLLDPGAAQTLVQYLAQHPPGGRLAILVGPEGGLTDAERDAQIARGAVPVSLPGPVLRIETAAELACGLVGQLARP